MGISPSWLPLISRRAAASFSLDTTRCARQLTAAPMLRSGTSPMVSLVSFRRNDQRQPGITNGVRPASGVPAKRMMGWLAINVLIALALTTCPAAQADELQNYQRECDLAIGPTVPDFDCDDPAATDVPGNEPNSSGNCDEPNRLNKVCDPGSRFRVLTRSEDAYVVAHCRKKGNASGKYGDIAVIQYSRKNGATCFYQALGVLSGQVKAPSNGQIPNNNSIWQPPSVTAGQGCGGCHDNGPFIRSPYLNQLKGGPNALPGSDPSVRTSEGRFFNSDPQPYAFVGEDFASWKAFKVEIAGNECNDCHRLGVNKVASGRGTALDFAERATAADEKSEIEPGDHHKNPPSAASPIWMPPFPVQVAFNQAHANAAKAIHDCGLRLQENPLPNTDSCRITPFAAAFAPPPPPPSTQDLTSIYYLILDGEVP
jgi:hypothetical protein